MSTLLFVHGTGVRGPAYDRAFGTVRAQAKQFLGAKVVVEPCLWGDALGVRLHHQGASVPTYVLQGTSADDESMKSVETRWQLLYADPLYELRTFAALAEEVDDENDYVGAIVAKLAAFRPTDDVLARAGHDPARLAKGALETLTRDPVFERAVNGPALTDTSQRVTSVARAFVAAWMRVAEEDQLPTLDGAARDRLYRQVVALLGGTLGLTDALLRAFGGLASRVTTPVIRAYRSEITSGSHAGTNDILLYQSARGGGEIRKFIAQRIEACAGPVYVLAHSLGGIASVDLLIERADLDVAGIITCGSQAPFLYETDALGSLRHDQPLPSHFPNWLNIYDLNDMLSFIGAGVFPGRVTDVEVRSRQPFPQAHSAYWTNETVWHQLASFVK